MVTRRWATRFPFSVVDPLWTHLIPGFIGNQGLSIVVERSKLLRSKSSNSFSGAAVFCCAMTRPPDSPRHVKATSIATKEDAITNALRREPLQYDFMTPPPVRESPGSGTIPTATV